MRRSILLSLFLLMLSASLPAFAAGHAWTPVGPDGGDARSFAPDPSNPRHIYLGTTDSWIYQSMDGGQNWQRLSKLGQSDNLILDNIVVDESDPKTLMVGAWVVDRRDGGLFISHDAGESWTSVAAMKGQSIRALAQSASNPKMFVAGTLLGVFRSEDGGVQWTQISPPGSMEIHEVESVAIDPKDPSVIYAGTWHLPWKTTNGGVSWHNIKQGLIDDSDVFSIIIDPSQTNIVYTSACSGIYKSENGGEIYHKIQGIPSTARRTRVLMQDPVNHDVVYAGTTEGLYKTSNAGVNWQRMTGPDVIVNDVHVDPANPQHVLLATDRGGVLESRDGAFSFKSANGGFSQRQIAALLVDSRAPGTVYAGALNDKGYGGVFVSTDGGQAWRQQSSGLEGRDVYNLAQAADGSLLAGTNDGLFHWNGSSWEPDGKILKAVHKTTHVVRHGRRVAVENTSFVPGGEINGRIYALNASAGLWSAATSQGIYISTDEGKTWQGGAILGNVDFVTLSTDGNTLLAGRRRGLAVSQDGGKNWHALPLPGHLTWLQATAITPDGTLWAGGREGVFRSQDHGASWQPMSTLPIADINELSYDPAIRRIIITSARSTLVLAVDPTSEAWNWWDAGWNVNHVRSVDGRLLAATLYNGVVAQPKGLVATASVNTGR